MRYFYIFASILRCHLHIWSSISSRPNIYKTWLECLLYGPLWKLSIFICSEIQDGWQCRNKRPYVPNRVFSVFSSLDPKSHVSFCYHLMCVHDCVVINFRKKSCPLKPLGQFESKLGWIIRRVIACKIMFDDISILPIFQHGCCDYK